MPNRQQVHGGIDLRGCVEHQIVIMQVFAQCVRGTCRQRCKLRQRFGRLRWVRQVAPADARKAAQVGDDRGAQLGHQRVEGKARVGFDQESLDGFQAFQKARGQFDPLQRVSHASWRAW